MDNMTYAMKIFSYIEKVYPLTTLRKNDFRELSAKRWALFEYAKMLLDHPNEDKLKLLELLIGRLACYISHMINGSKDLNVLTYRQALSALISLEAIITK